MFTTIEFAVFVAEL